MGTEPTQKKLSEELDEATLREIIRRDDSNSRYSDWDTCRVCGAGLTRPSMQYAPKRFRKKPLCNLCQLLGEEPGWEEAEP